MLRAIVRLSLYHHPCLREGCTASTLSLVSPNVREEIGCLIVDVYYLHLLSLSVSFLALTLFIPQSISSHNANEQIQPFLRLLSVFHSVNSRVSIAPISYDQNRPFLIRVRVLLVVAVYRGTFSQQHIDWLHCRSPHLRVNDCARQYDQLKRKHQLFTWIAEEFYAIYFHLIAHFSLRSDPTSFTSVERVTA